METGLLSTLMIALLFVMLLLGMHVGLAMGLVGLLGVMMVIPVEPALALFGQTVMETALSFELSVIPLFVLMGYITAESGMSKDLYMAFHAWFGSRRGGLAMTTIATCGAFGAISGSSVATAATMTEVALPEMRRFGYSTSLATGSIAAGGTIGILIPPSVIMVLYGILTETSIVDLFLAGVIPGILLVLLFLATIWVVTRLHPEEGPACEPTTLNEKLKASRNIIGMLILFITVMGGLYAGVFTPTEAAGIGAFGAWLIAVVMRRLSGKEMVRALLESVRTTVMIFTILIGALVFKNFMALAQVSETIAAFLNDMNLPVMMSMLVIILIYIVLGALLDTMAMIFLTVPIFFPLVTGYGFDPVWFGVLVVVLVEMALITPPMGMNVFIIKGMAEDVPLTTIYKGVMPFVAALATLLVLLLVFPEIALWLPQSLK